MTTPADPAGAQSAASYWASVVATPPGHMSTDGVSSTRSTSVAPGGPARLVRLQQAQTRRFPGYRKYGPLWRWTSRRLFSSITYNEIALDTWAANVDAQHFFGSQGFAVFNVVLRKKLASRVS
jgi:hypothetical protein